jgi:hypothetical protein
MLNIHNLETVAVAVNQRQKMKKKQTLFVWRITDAVAVYPRQKNIGVREK